MECDRSRKSDLIIHIRLRRLSAGMAPAEIMESVRGYRRKTVAELNAIATDENTKFIASNKAKMDSIRLAELIRENNRNGGDGARH